RGPIPSPGREQFDHVEDGDLDLLLRAAHLERGAIANLLERALRALLFQREAVRLDRGAARHEGQTQPCGAPAKHGSPCTRRSRGRQAMGLLLATRRLTNLSMDPSQTPHPILVTGATGFIGSSLVRELSLRGHRVRATSRSAPPPSASPRAEWR